MLLCNAAMRYFVVDGADDPGLGIVPADCLDTGGGTKGRVAAIRGDDAGAGPPEADRVPPAQLE